MSNHTRRIKAGQLPPTDIPQHVENYLQSMQLHRIDADQLQPGGIYFSEPPEHVSTDESRAERIVFWRRVVAPIVIATLSIFSAVAIAIF